MPHQQRVSFDCNFILSWDIFNYCWLLSYPRYEMKQAAGKQTVFLWLFDLCRNVDFFNVDAAAVERHGPLFLRIILVFSFCYFRTPEEILKKLLSCGSIFISSERSNDFVSLSYFHNFLPYSSSFFPLHLLWRCLPSTHK